MKVTSFAERLKQGLELLKIKPSELSRITNISKSSISHYLKGDWEGKQDAVYLIARALDVSEAWLMGYDVPMGRSDQTTNKDRYPTPTIAEKTTAFPVIGNIAAGYDHIVAEDWEGDTVEIPDSYFKGRDKSEFFVLRIKGDSMYPLYHDGDKVLVLKQATLNYSGEIGVVLYDDELGTLKKVEYKRGEDWMRLVPINPNYPPVMIEGQQLERCRILGIPKLLIREL